MMNLLKSMVSLFSRYMLDSEAFFNLESIQNRCTYSYIILFHRIMFKKLLNSWPQYSFKIINTQQQSMLDQCWFNDSTAINADQLAIENGCFNAWPPILSINLHFKFMVYDDIMIMVFLITIMIVSSV